MKEAVLRIDDALIRDQVRACVDGVFGGHLAVLAEVARERARQDEKWGEQNHPDGTGPYTTAMSVGRTAEERACFARWYCDVEHKLGAGTWAQILSEEHYEALAEKDPAKLRRELVQVAAVCVAWCEAIDRRSAGLHAGGDR